MGLKDEDEDLLPPSPTREPGKGGSALSTPFVPHPENQHSTLGQHSAPAGLPPSSVGAKPPQEGADALAKAGRPSQQASEETEEDWLSHALSWKKSRGLAREERALTSEGQNGEGAAGRPPSGRYGLGCYLPWREDWAVYGEHHLFPVLPSSGHCTEGTWLLPLSPCRHKGTGSC